MVDKLSALSCIEACISDINRWILSNKLKLNYNSKTEVLVIGALHRPHPQLDLSLVGDEHVVPTSSERNLGTVFDDNTTLESHVAAICKSAFFHIRNIARIKRYLSQANIETLIHAFVTCKLDHCNSLLIGFTFRIVLLSWLLVVVNTTQLRQCYVSQPWLPIEMRIVYRINGFQPIMLYNGLAPLYTCITVIGLSFVFLLAGFDHLIIMF